MFKIDDLILYGNTGVCRVVDISTKDIPGVSKNRLYYTLKPLYQTGTIYTPIDNKKVFMRPIISRQEAQQLISSIPEIDAQAFHSPVLSELTAHYERSIQSYDCVELAKLTKSLYIKKREMAEQKRKFGAIDDRFMKRAEDLLFGELAAALGIAREEVAPYISSIIE